MFQEGGPRLSPAEAKQHDRLINTPVKIVSGRFNYVNYDIQVEGDKTVYGFSIFMTCDSGCVTNYSEHPCKGGPWQGANAFWQSKQI